MYIQPRGGGGWGWVGCLFILLVFGAAFVIVSVAAMLMIGIGMLLIRIARYFFEPQPRLFGAWPISRWTSGYEQTFFLLDTSLGLDFSSTPMRLVTGSVAVTLFWLLVLKWLLAGLGLATGNILPLVALVLGLLTGLHLSKPPSDWFNRQPDIFLIEPELTEEEVMLLMENDEW